MGCIPLRLSKNHGTAEIDVNEDENSLYTIKEESSENEQSRQILPNPIKGLVLNNKQH